MSAPESGWPAGPVEARSERLAKRIFRSEGALHGTAPNRPLPKGLMVGHARVAVVGFLLVVVALINTLHG